MSRSPRTWISSRRAMKSPMALGLAVQPLASLSRPGTRAFTASSSLRQAASSAKRSAAFHLYCSGTWLRSV